MLDPYKRLLAYFDEGVRRGGVAHPTKDIGESWVAAMFLEAVGEPRYPVGFMAHDEVHVDWFALETRTGIHIITIDKEYYPDVLVEINEVLTRYEL